jgi:hypothetical protein
MIGLAKSHDASIGLQWSPLTRRKNHNWIDSIDRESNTSKAVYKEKYRRLNIGEAARPIFLPSHHTSEIL